MEEPLMLSYKQERINELLRLMHKIEFVNVTYTDDMLVMAQQAIRLMKRYAGAATEILINKPLVEE